MHEDQFRGYELAILGTRWKGLIVLGKARKAINLELVSKELNHSTAILDVLCRGFEFYEVKKKKILLLFFKKKMKILLHFLSFL